VEQVSVNGIDEVEPAGKINGSVSAADVPGDLEPAADVAGEVSRKADVVSLLVSRGLPQDRAVMYADVIIEYRTATENIERNGLIVSHPRTGSPIENPYLCLRDRALRKLQSMRGVDVTGLW
jgi:hypothetical protein